jgi:hypothetical protein
MKELFFNFIYLFKAPNDSNLVSIFELSDLFYQSTPHTLPNTSSDSSPNASSDSSPNASSDSSPNASSDSSPNASSNVLLPANEELFYTKLRTIIKKCYYNEFVKKENESMNTLIALLKNNHLIKK